MGSQHIHNLYVIENTDDDQSFFGNSPHNENLRLNDLNENHSSSSFVLLSKNQYRQLRALQKQNIKIKNNPIEDLNDEENLRFENNIAAFDASDKFSKNLRSNISPNIAYGENDMNSNEQYPVTTADTFGRNVASKDSNSLDLEDVAPKPNMSSPLDRLISKQRSSYPSSVGSCRSQVNQKFILLKVNRNTPAHFLDSPDIKSSNQEEQHDLSVLANKDCFEEDQEIYVKTIDYSGDSTSPGNYIDTNCESESELVEESSSTSGLTPMPKSNYIEDVKRELLRNFDQKYCKILSVNCDDSEKRNFCSNARNNHQSRPRGATSHVYHYIDHHPYHSNHAIHYPSLCSENENRSCIQSNAVDEDVHDNEYCRGKYSRNRNGGYACEHPTSNSPPNCIPKQYSNKSSYCCEDIAPQIGSSEAKHRCPRNGIKEQCGSKRHSNKSCYCCAEKEENSDIALDCSDEVLQDQWEIENKDEYNTQRNSTQSCYFCEKIETDEMSQDSKILSKKRCARKAR